jgi:CheY-like chemotaxis protein
VEALILDNKSANLRQMCSAAEELGHTVSATGDPREFLDLARRRQPDLQIVDFKLDGIEQQVGIRDGLELVAVSAAESVHVPTIFFTNFSADAEGRLGEFDPRLVATMIQKPVGDAQGDWREKLAKAIHHLAAAPSFNHPEPIGLSPPEMRSRFFFCPVSELHCLSEDARDELEIEVTEELLPYLESAWPACEDDWLMVSRVDDAILVVDRGADRDLPTVEEVRDMEAERDAGILTVGRPTFLEEAGGGPVSCTPKEPRNWRRYPYVSLILGGQTEREFHLDTGAPRSYISREFVLEATDVILKNPSPGRISNFGESVVRQKQSVKLPLHIAGPHGNFSLSLSMEAIKNWHEFEMLNPWCSGERCPRSNQGQCGRRLGLIGRDLLYELQSGVWQFDPATGQFFALAV